MKIFSLLPMMVFLSFTVYTPAFAVSYNEKTCDDESGLMCWQCGTDCTATLYDGGKLIVSGTGWMSGGSNPNSTFSQSSNPNLPQAITSIEFEEGITGVGSNALWWVTSVQQIKLADSITTLQDDGIGVANRTFQLILSENSQLNFYAGDYENVAASVFCKGDTTKCAEILNNVRTDYTSIPISNEIRDSNNNLIEKCSSAGCEKYNSEGGISEKYDLKDHLLEKYNDKQQLLASYTYDADGNQTGKSVYNYDSGGNLISAYENGRMIYAKTIYTPSEAAAATKPRGNTVSITW